MTDTKHSIKITRGPWGETAFEVICHDKTGICGANWTCDCEATPHRGDLPIESGGTND